MPSGASARRYAQAVFQIALERDELDEWVDDLAAIASSLSNIDFSGLLDAPQVPASEKIEAAKNVLGGTVGPLALNLVSLLATRNLVRLAPDISEAYGALLDAHRGIERALVTTAVPLDEGHAARVAEMLEGIVGRQVQVSSAVDPQILGGLVAQIGDRVIDGSARTRLRAMRREVVDQAR
jgi:F-type H+-transporting ATPase subunit delta